MRLIFKLIIIFDILVILAGLFFIFDKIMRSRNVELHFLFRPFEKDGKKGYALFDDSENCVYYALKEGNQDNRDIYVFKNCKTRLSSTHKISEMLRNNNAPNFSRKTFYFDKDEVWGYIRKHGYNLQTTIVDDKLTQYKIHKGTQTVAFSRKRSSGEGKYSLRTYERDIGMLFTILFAIAKTDEKKVKKTTEKDNTKKELND